MEFGNAGDILIELFQTVLDGGNLERGENEGSDSTGCSG